MASSGTFYAGPVTASGSVSFSLPPGVTLASSQVNITIGSGGSVRNIADGGWVNGTSGSVSGYITGCGVAASAYLVSTGVGSDGKLYSGTIVSLDLAGITNPGQAGGDFTFPTASAVLQAFPTAITGTGTINAFTLTDNTTGLPVAVGQIGQSGSGWTVAVPTLVHGRTYTASATFTDPGCAASVVRNRTFSIPVTFTRQADWSIVSPIGPAVLRSVLLRTDIAYAMATSWAISSQINSPLVGAPDAGSVAAALGGLHSFRARLYIMWDGSNWDEETSRLLSASGVDDVNLQLRYLNSSEATFELDNGDDRFGLTNTTSPISSNLRRLGQPVRLEAGYGGYMDRVFYGFVESIVPRARERIVTIRALDRSAKWRAIRSTYPPNVLQRTDAIMRSLLTTAGFVEGVDFVLDVGDVTIPVAVASDVALLPELQALAQAEGGRAFFDSSGVFRFWSQSHTRRVQATPVVSLSTDEHLYELGRSTSPTGLATRVSMEWQSREYSATPEIVFDSKVVFAVPPAYNNGVNYVPGSPVVLRAAPMDLTRWERYVPAEFTSLNTITANTARDGSGSAVTTASGTPVKNQTGYDGKLYYALDFGVGYAEVTLVSFSPNPIYVTALKLNGRPQRSISPVKVTARDQLAADDIELVLANPYGPDADVAMDRVREELALRKDPLARLDIPLQDGLAFLRPFDVLRVVDRSVRGVTETLDSQALRNEWRMSTDQGYTQNLVLGPALPAQYAGAAAGPTVTAAGTATTDADPVYRWGADPHPLVWGFSQWS